MFSARHYIYAKTPEPMIATEVLQRIKSGGFITGNGNKNRVNPYYALETIRIILLTVGHSYQ